MTSQPQTFIIDEIKVVTPAGLRTACPAVRWQTTARRFATYDGFCAVHLADDRLAVYRELADGRVSLKTFKPREWAYTR